MFGFFEGLVNPFRKGFSATESNSVPQFLIKQIFGIKKIMLLVAVCSMCTAATEVYIFKFLGSLVDAMEGTDNFFVDNLSILIGMCLILLVGLPLVVSVHTLLGYQSLQGNLQLRMLSNIHEYLLKQNVQFYQVEAAGKIANTLLQTVVSTKLIVFKMIDTFIFAFVFTVSMVLLLASIDLILLLPVILWFIGYVFVILYFVPKLRTWSTKQAESRSIMVGQLVDTYTNIATVKLFSHSSAERSYAKNHMSGYLESIYGQMRFMSKVQFLMWGLNIMLIFSTFVLSISLWGNGMITVGAIAAAVGVAFRVYTMSHWIMWEIAGLFENLGVVQDGIKLLSRSLPKSVVDARPPLQVQNYNISFKDISFSYNKADEVIKGFSLDISAGEKVGIIGRSGSGKSTLTRLLLRFFELDSGTITIGGVDIRLVGHESLLEKIAVVAQDVELLDRSIRENLTYGKRGASEVEIIEAAKAAGAHSFILDLIDDSGRRGYDAHVGVRGAKLSGGQRQRISLARALIKNAPILVFDEATSALDSEIESHVMNHMRAYLEGKVVVMIAHRITTLAEMDRLIIIENGKLVEQGTHDELIIQKGYYFKMLAMQSDKVIDGDLCRV